jgi:hypothetical protein
MNIGRSTRLSYDRDAYPDRLHESVSPLSYRINADQIYNKNRCFSALGPRNSYMGHGVSTFRDIGPAEAQDLTDLDSILTNRNVKTTKARRGHVNPVNPLKFKLHNAKQCDNSLHPEYTMLSHPSSNYRDMSINRFYNLLHDPQENIFVDFSVNTRLEAKDNFRPEVPQPWPDRGRPVEKKEDYETCSLECGASTHKCPVSWRK